MDSAFVENYRFLARYNRWMNHRLYTACEALTAPIRTPAANAEATSVTKRRDT